MMSTHSGTHLDAPSDILGHKLEEKTLEKIDLEKFFGEALVVNIPKGPLEPIDESELVPYRKEMAEVKRVLLNTGWHMHWGKPEYFREYPGLTYEAARLIANQRIFLLGIDIPSLWAGDEEKNKAAHQIILESDIVLVETMNNLSSIKKKRVYFIGLPLNIPGVDGSPIRAIAIEEE